ncbi:MAG: glucose-6-phosphate dehydrogenase [Polyangiaceae bacterium]
MEPSRSDALTFFGATGDLAFKQIFPAMMALTKRGRLEMPIVAIGRKEIGVDEIRKRAHDSLAKAGPVDEALFDKLAKRLSYVAVDYDKPETFKKIRDAIPDAKHPLHYVALPPDVFEKVAANLASVGLAKDARITLEKPFGNDLASAKALSEAMTKSFPEEAIFRIDHFLGKEPVENIVYFRAANPIIESSLSSDHVESVEITMAETFGVEGRAKFYDDVGAIRDVVQNHLLELVACIAMDLPTERGHSALRGKRSELLSQIKAIAPSDLVRGQVRGYKNEEGVSKDSKTETFAVLKVEIDTPRWKGVPFFIRTGKSLPVTVTEMIVRFRTTKEAVLEDATAAAPNHLRLRVGPTAVIALGANVKKNGQTMAGEKTELVLQRSGADEMKAYERLIGDAIDGFATLFARRDAVEESWRVVGEIIGNTTPIHEYDKGSWGPAEAAKIAPAGGFTNPG